MSNSAEEVRADSQSYYQANKERLRQKRLADPAGFKRTRVIATWRHLGVIHDDYSALYDEFLAATHCEAHSTENEEKADALPTSKAIAARLTAALAEHPTVKPLSATTANAYGCHLRRILKAVPGNLDDPAYPPKAEYTKCLADVAPTSRTSVAGAMVKWAQVRPGGSSPATIAYVDQALADAFVARTKARPDPNVPTQRQMDNMTTLGELKKVLNDRRKILRREGVIDGAGVLPSNLYSSLREWVAGSLYIADPDNLPRRLEYRSVQIISEAAWRAMTSPQQEVGNWLVVTGRNKKVFVLNDYKASNTYGQFRNRVGKVLNKVLNVWLKYHHGKYLLSGDEPLTQQQMGELLRACFAPTGKLVSVNALRHAVISSLYPPDAAERQERARLMGHSVEMQIGYVLKPQM
jgi:hypothetical protein